MATKHRTGHLFKRGDNFYVRWIVEGKAFSKALRDDDGNAIKAKREAEIARGKLMAPFVVADEKSALESIVGKLEGRKAELAKFEDERTPALTIDQAWAAFMSSTNRPDSGEETLYQYECQFRAFVDWIKEKYPEAVQLRQVSASVAEEYMGTLNHGRFSPNTYNKHLNLLTLVFRVVKDKAKLESNPWEGIQRKRLATHSRRELTIDELRKVCQSATGDLRILLAEGIYTGLRLGDCATLQWGEVDLTRAIITRIPNKTARRKPKPVIVPIHPVLLAMLAEIPEDKRGEFVLPEIAATYEKRIDLVTDLIQNHFKACGIKIYKRGTGTKDKRAVIEVGFHSLRHSFVSLCRASNAPLAVVESIVGHSNPAMTRHYTHVGEVAAGKAVALLPFLIGDEKPVPAKRDSEAVLSEARAIAEKITADNWEQQKSALLSLLPSPQAVG